MRAFLMLGCLAAASIDLGAQASAPLALPKTAPTVDQILSLKRVGSPDISP